MLLDGQPRLVLILVQKCCGKVYHVKVNHRHEPQILKPELFDEMFCEKWIILTTVYKMSLPSYVFISCGYNQIKM